MSIEAHDVQRWPYGETESSRVFEHDPDLTRALAPEQAAQATRHALAQVASLRPGHWTPPADGDYERDIGVLLLDGLLARSQTVAKATTAELLGAGDILRPWVRGDEESSLSAPSAWEVLQPTRVALLDAAFARRVAPWPEIATALIERSVQRARLLAFQMAVSQLRRVDMRLLLLLWRFADRWGRVTPGGVVLPMHLTHTWLARLVGAQRPSVTTALGQLGDKDAVQRLGDGSWLLKGDPPAEMAAGNGRV
jgi:hypothetical protein